MTVFVTDTWEFNTLLFLPWNVPHKKEVDHYCLVKLPFSSQGWIIKCVHKYIIYIRIISTIYMEINKISMTFKQWLTFSSLCILQGTPKPKLPMVLRPTKSAQTSVSLCLPHFLVCICSLFLNFIKSKICLWVFLFLIWLVFDLIFKKKIEELIFLQDTLYLIHKNIQEDFSAQVEFYTYILLVMM